MSLIHRITDGDIKCKNCTETVEMHDLGFHGNYCRTEFKCGCTLRRSDFPFHWLPSGMRCGAERLKFDTEHFLAVGMWSQ